MFFANPFKLSQLGILGMNRRNVDFVHAYNPRNLYPNVDNKLKTKILAEKAGISVPKLYGVIEFQHQVKNLSAVLQDYSEFVIKPSKGSAGKGILVVTGKEKDTWIKASGTRLTQIDIDRDVSNILSGLYSLGGQNDKAMIESLVRFSPIFKNISYQGVPDIRVLVFLGVPVMAMLRLSTKESEGRANLHQGAVGVGIDLRSGTTLCGVYKGALLEKHPDTKQSFKDIKIPNWHRILCLASRCYEMTNLGYLGIDIVIDEKLGPMILEVNARPGLGIQIANQAGLLSRLKKITLLAPKALGVENRVNFAKEQFSSLFLGREKMQKYLL